MKLCIQTLSIFSLCSDDSVWKNNVRNLLQHKDTFEQSLRVQEAMDKKFSLRGSEIADTQNIVANLRNVMDARLKATGEAIRHLKIQGKFLGDCISVQRQFKLIVDFFRSYTSYLGFAYMHLKSNRASFVSY